jgi:uncharacterized protein YhaN
MREESSRLEETNSRLQQEVTFLKQRLSQLDSSYSQAESKLEADAYHARELQRELEEVKEESAKKLSESTQFVQMKKLMQEQSRKITDLRRRLARYEPDDAKLEDD